LSPGEILNVAETEKTTTADTDLRPLIRTQTIPRLLNCTTDLHTNTQNIIASNLCHCLIYIPTKPPYSSS
jgi:hypothetical protein